MFACRSGSGPSDVGECGGEGVDDAVDLFVGRDERRAERDGVGADGSGDHAEFEHSIADVHRVGAPVKLHAEDGDVTANMIDGAVGFEGSEATAESSAQVHGSVEQAVAFDDVEVRQGADARRRMAGVRVAVAQDEVGVGLECGADPAPTITPPSG